MGENERKQEYLTTGKLFSPYYIYSAGKAKVDVAGMSPPPPALLGEAKNPSPILRDGLGMRSGRRACFRPDKTPGHRLLFIGMHHHVFRFIRKIE